MPKLSKKDLLYIFSIVMFFVFGIFGKSNDGKKENGGSTLNVSHVEASAFGNIPFGSGLFVKIVEEEKPGVVNISTTTKATFKHPDTKKFKHKGQGEDPFKDFFEKFFGMPPNDMQIPRKSLGSGFIIDKEGHILTNNHVIEGADEIKVTLENDKEYDAEIIGADPKTDIALIKIKSEKDFPYLKLGDSDSLRVGEWVIAIGNPFGLSQTVTAGVVSAKERNIGAGPYDNFIQTDAAINRGNSGGPLINTRAEVIGINAAIFSGAGGNIGIGFAIPVNMVKGILNDLKEKGTVTRGWLGVMVQRITPELAKSFNLEEKQGALVGDVIKDGPAEKAGIRRGDIILKFNGTEIRTMEELPRIVAETRPDTSVAVLLLRNKKRKEITVELGKLKDDSRRIAAKTTEKFGIEVKNITEKIAQENNLENQNGVIVISVDMNSPAKEGGIMVGDLITEINHKEINNIDEYQKVAHGIKEKETVLFLIKRGTSTLFVALTMK